jgi:hypothetical protein
MNGVNVGHVLKQVRANVISKYNDQLYRGVNTKNDSMAESAALSIVRLGGGMHSIVNSFRQKAGNNQLPAGTMDAVSEFIQLSTRKIQRDMDQESR